MSLPSNGRNGNGVGSLPVASRIAPASISTGLSADLDLAAAEQAGRSLNRRDVVFLEQKRNAVGQAFDDAVLALEHRGQIEIDPAELDAVIAEAILGEVKELAGIEQRLARDAADVEAGAAERALLFSTQATFMPSWAARMAATYPPGPAPMTTRSNRSDMQFPQSLAATPTACADSMPSRIG